MSLWELSRLAAPRRLVLVALLVLGCGSSEPSADGAGSGGGREAPQQMDVKALQKRAAAIFGTLPAEFPSPDNPLGGEKVKLGRMLFFDERLSVEGDRSCNTCHRLDRHGVGERRSRAGHVPAGGRKRNAPSVYNAALHVAQFWDGRAPDVEAVAREIGRDPEAEEGAEDPVLAALQSIPGYRPLFFAAFAGEEDAVSRENMGKAIGAFLRKLMTPGAFDAFLAGDTSALTEPQMAGLATFIDTGCVDCHQGPTVGGGLFKKLGVVKAYGTEDPGRFAVTGQERDRAVFKVPSLRNVAQTAPYFHDGSVETLGEAIRIMAEHQLGKELEQDEIASIRTFLTTLTGRVDPLLTAKPELPPGASSEEEAGGAAGAGAGSGSGPGPG